MKKIIIAAAFGIITTAYTGQNGYNNAYQGGQGYNQGASNAQPYNQNAGNGQSYNQGNNGQPYNQGPGNQGPGNQNYNNQGNNASDVDIYIEHVLKVVQELPAEDDLGAALVAFSVPQAQGDAATICLFKDDSGMYRLHSKNSKANGSVSKADEQAFNSSIFGKKAGDTVSFQTPKNLDGSGTEMNQYKGVVITESTTSESSSVCFVRKKI